MSLDLDLLHVEKANVRSRFSAWQCARNANPLSLQHAWYLNNTCYRKWCEMRRYRSKLLPRLPAYAFYAWWLFVWFVACRIFALLKKYLDSYVDCRDLTYGCFDFQKPQVDEFSDDGVNPIKRWWRWSFQVGYKSITSLRTIWFMEILNRRLYTALFKFYSGGTRVVV